MGGYGSGRPGRREVVEGCLALTIKAMMRDGVVRPGSRRTGTWTWTRTSTGEHVATIGYETQVDDNDGRIRLHYTVTRNTGETINRDYWIALKTTSQPFGGRRWWFICPLRGDRATKLFLPEGAPKFACRKAYNLAYHSQQQAPHYAALSRAQELRERLGGSVCVEDPLPLRPKRMRHTTYARHIARIRRAERIIEAYERTLVR